MLRVINKIREYIASKQNAWTQSTIKSESSRLGAVVDLLELKPDVVFKNLDHLAPYSRKTAFIRIADFMTWLRPGEGNEFKKFMADNKQVFRYVYKKEVLQVDYEQARQLLDGIVQADVRNHASFLLKSGLRLSESYSIIRLGGNCYVDGKGGKRRRVFAEPPGDLVRPHALRTALRKIGLKPHSLRKLFLTKLVNSGMPLQDVAKVSGHSNIATLMCYLQSKKDDELQTRIRELT